MTEEIAEELRSFYLNLYNLSYAPAILAGVFIVIIFNFQTNML